MSTDTPTGIWIAAGALVNAIIVVVFGYFRERPLVPVSSLTELRATVKELRERIGVLEQDNKSLREENRALERSREFWRSAWEELKEKQGDC